MIDILFNNPCDNCIVDIMCLDVCDRFIFYMNKVCFHFTFHLEHLVNTESRLKRSLDCSLKYQRCVQFHKRLHTAEKNYHQNKKEIIRNERRFNNC